MLVGHEWSKFGQNHRTLRVTSPRRGQRSTYWLQIPYTYAIPLMTLSGILHWLTSQSIFFARVEISDPFGKISDPLSGVGYSCIPIIFVLTLCILALLAAAGMGFKRFSAEITTVGCCSAAISAACHTLVADSEEIVGKKLRWGDVGHVPNLGARHLTFSTEKEIGKPVFGEVYLGTGREKEWLFMMVLESFFLEDNMKIKWGFVNEADWVCMRVCRLVVRLHRNTDTVMRSHAKSFFLPWLRPRSYMEFIKQDSIVLYLI